MQVPMPKVVVHHSPITMATVADKASATNHNSLWPARTHGERGIDMSHPNIRISIRSMVRSRMKMNQYGAWRSLSHTSCDQACVGACCPRIARRIRSILKQENPRRKLRRRLWTHSRVRLKLGESPELRLQITEVSSTVGAKFGITCESRWQNGLV